MGLVHTDGGVCISMIAGWKEKQPRYVPLYQISPHAGMKGSYVGRSTPRDPSLPLKPHSSQWGASLPLEMASGEVYTCIKEIRFFFFVFFRTDRRRSVFFFFVPYRVKEDVTLINPNRACIRVLVRKSAVSLWNTDVHVSVWSSDICALTIVISWTSAFFFFLILASSLRWSVSCQYQLHTIPFVVVVVIPDVKHPTDCEGLHGM